jgi:hypothetical protein
MVVWDRARFEVLLVAVAAVLVGCDPGYAAMAENRSDHDLVVREFQDRLLLPAHATAVLYATLGSPKEAPPTTFEFVDATSCKTIGQQRVDWAVTPRALIVIAADGVLTLDTPSKLGSDTASIAPDLALTELCPGPLEGWVLWIVNPTPKTFYVRSDNSVARIDPSSTAVAIGGNAPSTLQLLDDACRVVDTSSWTGYGPLKGTIRDGHLMLEEGVAPDPSMVSYDLVSACHDQGTPSTTSDH